MSNHYENLPRTALSLTDHLAIDRTVLANERTLLAYARTALALIIVGGTCIHVFDSIWIQILGAPFLVGGVALMIWGWMRHQRTRRVLASALQRQTDEPDRSLESHDASAQ